MNKFVKYVSSSLIKSLMLCSFVIAHAEHLHQQLDAVPFQPAALFQSPDQSTPSVFCSGDKPIPAVPLVCFGKNRSLFVYDADENLEVALAEYVIDLSNNYATGRGAFTVVLSGGYLIAKMGKLTESPYKEAVEWDKWHIFWIDERVVKKDSNDSNYKLAYDGFLSKVPIPPSQIYSINDSLSAEGAADDYEARLKQLVETKVVEVLASTGFPRFDLSLMDMGPDGHIASLFPGHRLLKEKQRWVTFIEDSPKPPPQRITFTFPVIDAFANIAMVVAGSGEVDALKKVLSCTNISSDPMPVQIVSLENGQFTWFTDKEAISNVQDVKCL